MLLYTAAPGGGTTLSRHVGQRTDPVLPEAGKSMFWAADHTDEDEAHFELAVNNRRAGRRGGK